MAKPQDDRRRKLDEIKRKQKSSARRGTIVVIVFSLMAAAVLIGFAAREASKKEKAEDVALAAIGGSAQDAGCGEVKNADEKSGSANHVQGNVQYPNPPSNGPHNPTWITSPPSDHFWERGAGDPPEKIVHSLEHGWVVVWYDDDLPAEEVENLKKIGEAEKSRKFVIAPWQRGKFEGDADVALTAWARMRTCKSVSGTAIAEFIKDYQGSGPKSVAPEPAGP